MLKKFVLAMALLGCAMKYTLAEPITLPAENLNFQIAGIVLEQADIPRGQERDYQPITLRLPRYSAAIGKGDIRTWWVKEPLWVLDKSDVLSMSPRLDEMLEDGHLDITFSKQAGQKLSQMTADAMKHHAYVLVFNHQTNESWMGANVLERIDGGKLRLTTMPLDTIPQFKEAVARQEIAFALAIPSENHEKLSGWSLRTVREIQIKRQKGMRDYPAWVHQPSRLTSDDMKSLIIDDKAVMDDALLYDHRLGMLELTNKGWQKWRWLETKKAPNPIPQIIFLQKDGTPISGASAMGSRPPRRVSIFMSPEAIQKMILRQP